MINTSFTATIVKEPTSGWTCVVWEDSVATLGTGKPFRVSCSVDGIDCEVTLMPIGGKHMVPLKAEVRKKLGKEIGDSVEVTIKEGVTK